MKDTKTIRNRMLKLAFQGHLSERLSTDSDVNMIIKACRRDKKVSILEGKCKNEVFRGGVENENIENCIIPKSWVWMYISDMSLFQEGPGILAADFRATGVPLIRIAGMNGDTVELTGCNYLAPDMVEEKWSHFKLEKGDIILSSSASLDRIAEVDEQAEGAIPYTGLIRFKMYGGINKEYFMWFIKSPYYKGQVDKQKQGGFIQHYGPSHLRKMIIPIPSLEEQGRIVNRLDELFEQLDIIDTLQHQCEANLSVLKEKVIDAGIRGKLTEQLSEDGDAETLYSQIQEEKEKLIKGGVIKKEKALPDIDDNEVPFVIPSNWKWVRLSDIVFLSSGRQYEETLDGDMYIKVSDMNLPENESEIITSLHFTGGDNSGAIPVNSIIFPKRGGAIATNKKRMILREPVFVDLNTMGMTMILPDTFMYVKYWFDTIKLDEIQNGTTIPQINNKDIYPLILPLPPLAEQKRIVCKITSIMHQIWH